MNVLSQYDSIASLIGIRNFMNNDVDAHVISINWINLSCHAHLISAPPHCVHWTVATVNRWSVFCSSAARSVAIFNEWHTGAESVMSANA